MLIDYLIEEHKVEKVLSPIGSSDLLVVALRLVLKVGITWGLLPHFHHHR